MRYTLVITGWLFATLSFGQSKFEKEYRIKESEVPADALSFIKDFSFKRGKWYRELSDKGVSIEFKGKLTNRMHSIEFDTTGLLLDAEITYNEKELDSLHAIFLKNLSKEFAKVKIYKIQRQLIGKELHVARGIRTGNLTDLTIHYELVIKGRKEDESELYEVLFDATGKLIEYRIIETRNTDNLEF